MKLILSELVTAFVLVALSDGVAALLAARACWRLRSRPKARQLALPLAIVMATIALVDLSDMTNFVVNGVRNPVGVGAYQALAGRVVRSAAVWYLALKLMNGYSGGHTEGESNETTSQ
jgi:hypothetical protein